MTAPSSARGREGKTRCQRGLVQALRTEGGELVLSRETAASLDQGGGDDEDFIITGTL